jgi:hypothetical protein
MSKRLAILSIILLAVMVLGIPACGQQSLTQTWVITRGTCKGTVICDSAVLKLDYDKGGTKVILSFSNGDLTRPILGWSAHAEGSFQMVDVGSILFADTVYLDGKEVPLNHAPNAPRCQFYFSDHGTFTSGWEHRLTAIECQMRLQFANGDRISKEIKFDNGTNDGITPLGVVPQINVAEKSK